MEESAVENEPNWIIEDDSSMRYPQYVALLLWTGLRFGISCEKMHQLFQISGTWRLESRKNRADGKKVSTSMGSEDSETKKKCDANTNEEWLSQTTLFPVSDSFEDPSKATRYCAHLQRESASTWAENPSSLPSFHYCRKVEATQEEKSDSGCNATKGNVHFSGLRKESSIMTFPLDCLYCFNEQLFREENDEQNVGKHIRPALVVDTLATEDVSETESEDESAKCAGTLTSSVSPLSSSLLRHYQTHQKRYENLLCKLKDDEESGQTKAGLTEEHVHEIEAAAEKEARHCTFVCVAGTTILPVVVTYCAACEIFGPLTSFRYDPPFLPPELAMEENNVDVKGQELLITHGSRQEVSPSLVQDSSSWISADSSLMIVARLLVALHVMEIALPDLLQGVQRESSTLSRHSFLHSFLPDLPSQEGSPVAVDVTSLKETKVTKAKVTKSCQAATHEEMSVFSTPIPSHGSPRSLDEGASGESFDLRAISAESKRSSESSSAEVEIGSKFLFLPTPLMFQDPPPTSSTSTFSEEEIMDPKDDQERNNAAYDEARQYLTDTFETYMEEMVSVEAVLPGACWAVTKKSEPSALPKVEEHTDAKKNTVSEERETYGGSPPQERLAVRTGDLSSLPKSDTKGKDDDFLLYVCNTSDLSCRGGGIMDVVPIDEMSWWRDKGEKEGKRIDRTPVEEAVNEWKEIPTPCHHPVASPGSSCELVVHDVLVGILVAFPSPEVLARCIQESLVPRIQQELKKKEAMTAPLVSSSCHRYYSLPYRLTHREVYLPEEERWVKAAVLYHEDYSYPFCTKNAEVTEGTLTGSGSMYKERWLGEDANGFRRACATYSLFVPAFHSLKERPTENTSFPSYLPSFVCAAPPVLTALPSSFPSQQGRSENYTSHAESDEEEDVLFLSPSSTCIPLIENSQLVLTRNHPFSLEAHRLKVLLGVVVLAKAMQEVLHATPMTTTSLNNA